MRIKKRIFTIIAAAILSAVVVAGVAPVRATGVARDADFGLKDEYPVGTSFNLPKADGAYTVMYAPSGLAYSADRFTLNETGKWKFICSTSSSRTEKEITVYKPTFSVTSASGSVARGTNSLYKEYDDGLLVSIPKGASFEYGEVIDLNDLTSADNLIEFGMNPAVIGTRDCSRIYITLTDIYDKNNKVVVSATDSDSSGRNGSVISNLRVSFTDSVNEIGLTEINTKDTYDVDNFTPRKFNELMYWNGSYGAYSSLSFGGIAPKISSVSFDIKTNRVYSNSINTWCNRYQGTDSYGQINGEYKVLTTAEDVAAARANGTLKQVPWDIDNGVFKMIADLDDLDYSGCYMRGGDGFINPFKGFTTGEVYLSVSCDSYSVSSAGVFIKSICGADFSQTKSVDTVKPIIKVDCEDISSAMVGSEYKLFPFTAVDNEAENCNARVEVYFVKNGSRIFRCSVSDGKFVPEREGDYEIVYVATDGFGNTSRKSVTVKALKKESATKPQIDLAEGYAETGVTGKTIKLASATSYSPLGRTTEYSSITFEGSVIAENATGFTPVKAGVYTVSFVAYDYIGQKSEKTYEIEVADGKTPILDGEIVLPTAFLNGSTYRLPVRTAFVYEQGEIYEVAPEISVDENGEERVLTDGVYKATYGGGSVKVKYRYSSRSGEENDLVCEFAVPVIKFDDNAGYLQFEKYFACGQGVTATLRDNAVALEFTSDGQTASFVNPLAYTAFEMQFSVGGKNGVIRDNAKAVYFRFTDCADTTRQIVLCVEKDELGRTFASVNGGKKYAFSGSLSSLGVVTEVTVDELYDNFYINNQRIAIESFADGRDFTGFTNAKFNFSVSAELCEEYAAANDNSFVLLVSKLSNQQFSKVPADFIAPVFTVFGEAETKYSLGAEFTTFKAVATDVVNPEAFVTYRVTDPSGNAVVSVDGVKLQNISADKQYAFKLTEYGYYKVIYTYSDGTNGQSKAVSVFVPETEAPTVSLSATKIECKKGKTAKLPSMTFSDDGTPLKDITVNLSYFSPSGRCYSIDAEVNDGKVTASFVFDEVGTWVVSYLVCDSSGNATFAEVVVTVR